jgi:hypothetical protein
LESSPALRRYDDVRELIAHPQNPTPLVRLNRVVPRGAFDLYVKLEWFNPFGSIKDRTAFYLLKGMAERGELDGKSLVEPSSGNTGIALAAIAALMQKKIVVTIPDGVPEEIGFAGLDAEYQAGCDDLEQTSITYFLQQAVRATATWPDGPVSWLEPRRRMA